MSMSDSERRELQLKLYKGPLTEQQLEALARLYGTVDAKYASLTHCDQLFHRNPFGPTLHAFAQEGERYVGHYSLIPYDLVVDGRKVKAAKGEALYIEPDSRRTTVEGRPASEALMLAAMQLAREEGIKVLYAIAGAPGVVRLFERCGHLHQPFLIQELIVPPSRALPLQKRAQLEWARRIGTRACKAESLQQVNFEAVERHFPWQPNPSPGHWQAELTAHTLTWFGPAPSNRYFQLGQATAWLTETHSDWELIASFSAQACPCQRRRLALELREEATRRGIDRIRIPKVVGVEAEIVDAFAPLARRQVEREISWICKSEIPLGRPSPHAFLWSHF